MKVLVTGGGGVVGEGLIPALIRAGHRVTLLSRGAREKAKEFAKHVSSVDADVTSASSLVGAAEECDVVVHVVGMVEERPPEVTFVKVNVEGTTNILREAERAGVRRFIYVSSLGADRGRSEYHQSKHRAESLVRIFSREWVILRAGNVYGPGDEVISMLLKMVRVLPAVPVIDAGTQPFQPIWYEDLGEAVARAVAQAGIAGQTFALAGKEITTVQDLLRMMGDITGRHPLQVPLPSVLAQVGVQLDELLGNTGSELLRRWGLSVPLNASKLHMLLEENTLRSTDVDALTPVFNVVPTPLETGLRRLADSLPEMSLEEGFGSVHRKRFWAEITGSPLKASELMNLFRENINEVMPIEFAAEPGVPTRIEYGATLTAALPVRGNIQVRVIECTDEVVTFICVEGHPLAGVVRFKAAVIPEGLSFTVEAFDRASNVLDWLAMKTGGNLLQNANWAEVVYRMVQLSGGRAVQGVQSVSQTLTDREAEAVSDWINNLITEVKRREHALA